MLEIKVIASGSKGNAVLVSSGKNKILIDCGVCIRKLTEGLTSANTTWNNVKAILVTHEHDDHIKSCTVVQDNYAVPVFTNADTMSEIKRKTGMKGGYYFEGTAPFTVAGMEVRPFKISHDAVYPVGYSISDGESRFVYATDLGYFSQTVLDAVKGADAVLIEANHDVSMLLNGKYPPFLKQRILGERGHLSNEACGKAIIEIMESGTKNFILGHISEQNNTYDLARESVTEILASAGATENKDYSVWVATQSGLTEVICAK